LSTLPLIGCGGALALIAGPCVIESEEHVQFLAREIGRVLQPHRHLYDIAQRAPRERERTPPALPLDEAFGLPTERAAKLAQVYDDFDTAGGLVVEPNDLPLDSRHLDMQRILLAGPVDGGRAKHQQGGA